MSQRHRLTRRQFLCLSTLATAGAVASACGGPLTPEVTEPESTAAPAEPTAVPPTAKPEEPEATAKPAEPTAVPEPVSMYKEAPMLAALVASGDLPPVEERLPLNPYIVDCRESIGKYGGNLRRGFKGVSDRWGPTKHVDRTLVWLDRDMNLVPRLIESWDVSDDAKTFTFHLRKGLKYSDGVELTSADFKWYYEHYAAHPDLQPGLWTKFTTIGEDGKKVLCEAEFPDDYTVVYKFAHPNPLLMYQGLRELHGFSVPSHYMKQFHIDTTDDKAALEAATTEAGFNAWNEYYEDRHYFHLNPDHPWPTPWIAKNSLNEELFIMERNPYYFAVDPEGNQLPYIDTVTHRLFEAIDVFNLWIVNGEIDFHNRHVSLSNYSLFKENEANGDYKVFVGISAVHDALQLNLATKEPKLNEFFNTREVRIAISHAINRDEYNDLIYDGMCTPRQYSPISLSANYYPKLSEAYIDYDPDLANQMLDDAGYDKRNSEGYRMFKDGSGPISFIIEGTADPGSSAEDGILMVVKYLNDVGIKATWKYFERALYTEHYETNEIEAAWWGGDRTVLPLAPSAIIFRGVGIDRPWAAGFGMWWNDETAPNGVKPPEGHFIWKIWEAWDKVAASPDPEDQKKYFQELLDVWAEELPMIGVVGEMPAPIIVKNGFHNYLPGQPIDDTSGDEHLLQTESYFWDDPDAHSA